MRTTLVILALLTSSAVFGQNNSTLGFQLHGFLPVGELKRDATEIWGAGFGTDIALQIKDSPVYLGAMFDFTRYGSRVRKGFHSTELPDVRYRHHNEMIRILPMVRIKPETKGRVMPYMDFHLGGAYVMTRARVYDRDIDEVVDTFVELDDFALNYGLGGGLEFILDEYVSLDLFVRSSFSSRAEYLTPKTIQYDPAAQSYQLSVQQSRFNSLTFGFGVKLLLREME